MSIGSQVIHIIDHKVLQDNQENCFSLIINEGCVETSAHCVCHITWPSQELQFSPGGLPTLKTPLIMKVHACMYIASGTDSSNITRRNVSVMVSRHWDNWQACITFSLIKWALASPKPLIKDASTEVGLTDVGAVCLRPCAQSVFGVSARQLRLVSPACTCTCTCTTYNNR